MNEKHKTCLGFWKEDARKREDKFSISVGELGFRFYKVLHWFSAVPKTEYDKLYDEFANHVHEHYKEIGSLKRKLQHSIPKEEHDKLKEELEDNKWSKLSVTLDVLENHIPKEGFKKFMHQLLADAKEMELTFLYEKIKKAEKQLLGRGKK